MPKLRALSLPVLLAVCLSAGPVRLGQGQGQGGPALGGWEQGSSGALGVPVAGGAVHLEPDPPPPPERVEIHLTHPLGKSPKIFTTGWKFGAVAFATSEAHGRIDLTSQIHWSGTGTFSPQVGGLSHPVFSAAGRNSILLTVTYKGKTYKHTFSGEAADPRNYAKVGDLAKCPADSHGCPSCPHAVAGPILTGSANVMINGKPAARVGDTGRHASCCGPNTFTILEGDLKLLIDGQPAARKGDKTKHCGGEGSIL